VIAKPVAVRITIGIHGVGSSGRIAVDNPSTAAPIPSQNIT
jgi:hypothetical protein